MSNALVAVKNSVTGGELTQLVSFNLDQEEYGVEVLKVREIIRMNTITHMPNTPHYLDGIINLRGKVSRLSPCARSSVSWRRRTTAILVS